MIFSGITLINRDFTDLVSDYTDYDFTDLICWLVYSVFTYTYF